MAGVEGGKIKRNLDGAGERPRPAAKVVSPTADRHRVPTGRPLRHRPPHQRPVRSARPGVCGPCAGYGGRGGPHGGRGHAGHGRRRLHLGKGVIPVP